MKQIFIHIDRNAGVYELVIVVLTGTGMILFVLHDLLARVIVNAGIILLAALYTCQFFRVVAVQNYLWVKLLTMNHCCILALLGGTALALINHQATQWVLLVGWSFMGYALFMNYRNRNSLVNRNYKGIQVRLLILTAISAFFYFSF